MSVIFSPDGKTLASGSSDQTVRLWEVATGTFVHAFKGHEHGVRSVVFSPDVTVHRSPGGREEGRTGGASEVCLTRFDQEGEYGAPL